MTKISYVKLNFVYQNCVFETNENIITQCEVWLTLHYWYTLETLTTHCVFVYMITNLVRCSCSKCYHSLVQLVMGSESTSDMAAKEEAWSVLEEVLRLMDQNKVHVVINNNAIACRPYYYALEVLHLNPTSLNFSSFLQEPLY